MSHCDATRTSARAHRSSRGARRSRSSSSCPSMRSRTISTAPRSTSYTRSPWSPWRKSACPGASSTRSGGRDSEAGAWCELDDVVREWQQSFVVRRDDDQATGRCEIAQQLDHTVHLHVVEVCGGLVGDDERWIECERPSDGDPLLLSARQLARTVSGALTEIDSSPALLAERARPRVARHPAPRSVTYTFSWAVRLGTRLKAWNTNPTWCRRYSVELRSA